MERFSYSRIHEQTRLEANGSTLDLAAEVGQLAHVIYNGLKQHATEDAELFRMMVLTAISLPTSPVWEAVEPSGDGVCIVIPREKKTDHRAGVVAGA